MSISIQTTSAPQPSFDGQRLRSLRRKRGLSADKLAQQADLCARQIWRMEAGRRPNVRAITLAQIARVLETSIDYLMGLTDRPEPYGYEDPDHAPSARQ
jgi:transcriptional regulator with XRE-family HTH domain